MPLTKATIKKFFKKFQKTEKDVPTNQDALGAYPLRMQISAVPERRYLRTARLLAVFCLLNLGALIALSGVFIYYAVRPDVRVANWRTANLFAMDPEFKVIRVLENRERGVSAGALALEKELRQFITDRYSVSLDSQIQEKRWGNGSIVQAYMIGEGYKNFTEQESPGLLGEALRQNVNKEVHIYSFEQDPSGMFTGMMEIFDMPPKDPFHPLCECSDNGTECLSCKIQHSLGRHRFQYFASAGIDFGGGPGNPMGIWVEEVYLVPKVIHQDNHFWDVPSILKPEL